MPTLCLLGRTWFHVSGRAVLTCFDAAAVSGLNVVCVLGGRWWYSNDFEAFLLFPGVVSAVRASVALMFHNL